MAILKYYDSVVHDLYVYNRIANPSQTSIPIGYNPNCQSAGIVDFSGCRARNRHFCKVSGSAYGLPYDPNNVNFWNPCTYGGVLISPRHMIVCQHYRGAHASPDINTGNIVLLGKSGLRYTVKVTGVTLSIGGDQTLLEFDQDVPPNEFYIYNKIANAQFIPKNTPVWIQDPNGKIYKKLFNTARLTDGVLTSYSTVPCLDGVNDGPFGTASEIAVFTGDSGSPGFVVNQAGDTVLLGLFYGGALFTQQTIDNINSKLSTYGYSVTFEKLSAIPEDINQDGVVDAVDLGLFMSHWDLSSTVCDFNNDGKIDAQDMASLLSKWGTYDMSPNSVNFTTVVNPNDSIGRK